MTQSPQTLSPEAAELLRQIYGPTLARITLTRGEEVGDDIEDVQAQDASGEFLWPTFSFMESSSLSQDYDGQGPEIIAGGMATGMDSQATYDDHMDGERAFAMILKLVENDEPAGLQDALNELVPEGETQVFDLPTLN